MRRKHHNPVLLTLVAISKLIKGSLLLIVTFGLLRLAGENIHEMLTHWVRTIHLDPDGQHIHGFIERTIGIAPHTLRWWSAGTLLYAALYLTEGVGLLMDKLWAEWLTVITTAGFIPFEIYEIARHATAARIVVLVINVLILVYLVHRLWQRHKEHAREKPTAVA